MKYFPPTELALNAKGEVYHLGLLPEQLAGKIILVGDQDRVAMVSSFFDNIEFTSKHREFVIYLKLKLKIITLRKFLPSADKRISKGIVNPLAFFQFEIHGGIFQSF